MQVTPASTNEITIAGPESVIASPMITKMPVPMTAPMPSAVRSSAPTARRRRVPSAVSIRSSVGLVASGPGAEVVAILAAGYPIPHSFTPAPSRYVEGMGKLDGKKVAFLATDGVEQVELTEPRKAIEDEGATTELLSLDDGETLALNHLDHGDKLPVDKAVADASADDYDGLVIPGGVANGDF